MDKQHFDHIESRIRQAANEISVPANDEAWKKMEVMLDAEFRKDRRRGGFLWWFFGGLLVLVVAGIFIYQQYTSIHVKEILAGSPVPNVFKSEIETDREPANNENGKTREKNESHNDERSNEKTVIKGENPQDVPALSNNKQNIQAPKHSAVKKEPSVSSRTAQNPTAIHALATSQPNEFNSNSSLKSNRVNRAPSLLNKNGQERRASLQGGKSDSAANSTAGITNNANRISSDSLNSNVDQYEKTNKQDSVANDKVLNKNSLSIRLNENRKKGLYFIGSVAGDVTAINNLLKQNLRPVYGAAMGYQFNKRFNVQAGFYTGKKIYAAGPDDYKIKSGSYIAKIIRADAVCDIYEIPVSIRYNALPRKVFTAYVIAGLSSVILKRETYDMHFYNQSGTYRRMSYTYKDNTALLSILNLAIGYEHKLSNVFYVQAEPYLKLPLSGLGEGKVKLNSAGVQLGIKYQPLKNKKKRI